MRMTHKVPTRTPPKRKVANETAFAPNLGPVQYLVLCTIKALSPRVTVNATVDYMYDRTGEILDVAHVFTAMQAFSSKEKNWIHFDGKITTTEGHRPSSSYSITPEGTDAIALYEKHMQRVLETGKAIKTPAKLQANSRR